MVRKSIAATTAALAMLPTGAGAMPSLRMSSIPASSAASADTAAKIALLREHVKYVFVLYQENRSFDSYFGTFPNADGIYSRPPDATLGYRQSIENVDGTFASISPFRIGPAQFAADTDDVDHSHPRLLKKMDVTSRGPQMDQFALVEEAKHVPLGASTPPLAAKQYGELTMAHEDCDTIPLLWNYANRFVLYDRIFQNYIGPSTPGNIAIISAQSGETQAALHPAQRYTDNGSGVVTGLPVLNDRDPAWPPNNGTFLQDNLTFATLPLTLGGDAGVTGYQKTDATAATDFADVRADVSLIHASKTRTFGWGWYEEGYAREPGETGVVSAASYIAHHNGPQYFGYIANSNGRQHLHQLGGFFEDVSHGRLQPGGGVFWVKGGYQNIAGLKPTDPDAAVRANFNGDDDHPGYSDAQISETLVAREVNAIATSKYWPQSAIVIAYDDSEGDYDHVAPPIRSIGPGVGNVPFDAITDGPRVPLMVISPFARTHAVSHRYGDQASVVKFVNAVFGLTPLADLPNELEGRIVGQEQGELQYGPDDDRATATTSLVDAFDDARLSGKLAPLPAYYAYVDPYFLTHFPVREGEGCGAVGVIPVDRLRGLRNVIPADFNPRPATDPTVTTAPTSARRAVAPYRDLDD